MKWLGKVLGGLPDRTWAAELAEHRAHSDVQHEATRDIIFNRMMPRSALVQRLDHLAEALGRVEQCLGTQKVKGRQPTVLRRLELIEDKLERVLARENVSKQLTVFHKEYLEAHVPTRQDMDAHMRDLRAEMSRIEARLAVLFSQVVQVKRAVVDEDPA